MTALRNAALRYAERGKLVFPVRGKVPLVPNGLRDATTDEFLIRRWWSEWPTANVAICTGAASKLVVLDVDGDEGNESLRALEADHGALPPTTSVVTPRGGSHYYWQHPGGKVRNSAGALGIGLDVRGDGGYVVAPPSIGSTGLRYEFDESTTPAPMPDWLRRAVMVKTSRSVPVGTWVEMVRNGFPEGRRNQGMVRLVGHLMAKGVHVRLVAEIAHMVNQRSAPPLPCDEVDRIVSSLRASELHRAAQRLIELEQAA